MISVIFCDDNSQFLSILPTQVRKECQKYIFRGEDIVIGPALGSGEEAINYIKAHHVDVLFLDIDMPI
jgi:CheY-like chemotaxis protein